MYLKLFGISLAAAVCFAFPAMAAATPAYDLVTPLGAPLASDQCVASLGVDQTILFTQATKDCDATMAELTGLCLVPVTEALPARIDAAFAPHLDTSCTAIRPSPPG